MLCAETYLPSDWEEAGKREGWEGAEGAHPPRAAAAAPLGRSRPIWTGWNSGQTISLFL